MHHRIMVRKERESKNEIARFGGLKPQIPAISNAAESEKQTLAQSLRGLFTDDYKNNCDHQHENDQPNAAVSSEIVCAPDCAQARSGRAKYSKIRYLIVVLAEGVGFEPTVPL